MFNSIHNKIEGIIDNIGHNYYIIIIFNIVYFATLIGVFYINSNYITTFNGIIHIILCFILIYRFNPLRKNIVLKDYDSTLIFSTAVFLLLNMGVVGIVKQFYNNNNNIKYNIVE